MVKKFSAQVDDIIKKNEKRLIALARQSNQMLIDQAQLPVAKGGKMRLDTGFLRASGQASLNGLPTGPTRGDERDYEYNRHTTTTTLAGLNLGGVFFFGWTANYASVRETYDGFLGSAVQNWQNIVDKVATEIKTRIK